MMYKLTILIAGVIVMGFGAVSPAWAGPITFSNTGTITIPGSGSSGPASPYPSDILVSALPGPVTKVTASLNGLSHTFPDDIDILLVGPTGANLLLMSDAGGSFDVLGVTLTFDDAALFSLPDAAAIPSGIYLPTDFDAGDPFSAPAPAGPYGSVFSAFNGTNPNGTWSLYVVDDFGFDVGSLSDGWSLTITADGGDIPEPSSWALIASGLVSLLALARRRGRAGGW